MIAQVLIYLVAFWLAVCVISAIVVGIAAIRAQPDPNER